MEEDIHLIDYSDNIVIEGQIFVNYSSKSYLAHCGMVDNVVDHKEHIIFVAPTLRLVSKVSKNILSKPSWEYVSL